MTATALEFASISETASLLAGKKISPLELTRLYLERIQTLDANLAAFITVTPDRALADAQAAERKLIHGRSRGPLEGVPIALKDNVWTRGVKTTAGSVVLQDFVPEEDATVVRKLRAAGAVLLGKTNLHEFAYGITGENPHYGATRNPWDTERISGGSSGGSAVATAAGLCMAAIGTDTGGSVRVPAALCGLVGLKPTFGRISRYGVVPLALSFDHMGLLCRSAKDAALMLDVLAGYDPLDEGSARAPRSAPAKPRLRSPKTRRLLWRLGRPRNFFWERLDPAVWQLAEKAVDSLGRRGVAIEEIELPNVPAAIEPANLRAAAEARAFHQMAGYFPARAADYGEDVRSRLEMGSEVRAVDYLIARETIRKARAEMDAALARVDAIVMPTTPIAAPLLGTEKVRIDGADQLVRSALLRLNRPGNFTGLPAVSVPCGFTPERLPVGLQLIGRAFDEATLLDIAGAYEEEHDWRLAHPQLNPNRTGKPAGGAGTPPGKKSPESTRPR